VGRISPKEKTFTTLTMFMSRNHFGMLEKGGEEKKKNEDGFPVSAFHKPVST
jgi:hypothetical protein